jgi:morphogenetic protein associated with SpoVID
MMPQQMMMPQHMSPYMACTPCHMWPAPQGQWGYQNPVRYY